MLVRAATALLFASAPPATRTRIELTAAAFENPGWDALKRGLDQLPTFTVANGKGQPLEYEIEGTPSAIFYADLEEAKKELAAAQAQYPDLGCDLIPVGVGSAYSLSVEGKAQLVPSTAELQRAGMPPGGSAMGQALPLFACMEMSQDSDNGPALPLFMSWADAKEAVAQASDTDSPDEELEIVGLSLPSVVERLSSIEKPAFIFIPPSDSAAYIREYIAG